VQSYIAKISMVLIMFLLFAFTPSSQAANQSSIKHVIVIFHENHTFDNYFGTYPGANGLTENISLPTSKGNNQTVTPFHLSNTRTVDLDHSRQAALNCYNNGSMDGFVYSEESINTLGYYNGSDIPNYWNYASKFVLLDNYFSSVMGPSLPNYLYLIAGQSNGIVENINNYCFDGKLITDELDSKNVSWTYYWEDGNATAAYNNPLPACSSILSNRSRINNLEPVDQFTSDVKSGNLASVVWIVPKENESEHPPNDIAAGEHYSVSLINTIMRSQYWDSSAIFLAWDDYGGWYDHVAPPQVDSFGYGFRTPCLIISPYVKEGLIDHTVADHTSILKFIEKLYGLPTLTTRDAQANDLLEAFDFSQSPRSELVLPGEYIPNHYPLILLGDKQSSFVIWLLPVLIIAFALIGIIIGLNRRKKSIA
jgi:phospholipase C